jgi:signal transduction histidine kinase/DNA-binding response OmpR family regulator
MPTGAWKGPPQQIVVLPLRSVREREPIGALLAGVNPHRRMDAGYRTFFETAARHISVMLIRARSLERERQLLAEKDRQTKAWAALADYAANEFRTPLTVLLGLLDQLQPSYAEKSPYGRKFALARRNALRVSHLVDSLMELIDMQSGRMRPMFEPVDLAATTEELVRAFSSALERKGLTYIIDCPSLDEPVFVDRRMWDRVILGLLVHSLQRTREGEIGVSLRKMGAWIEITIWDTGEGIPRTELAHIFEPFPPCIGGARMRTGLAIAQHFAAAHGGRITVESDLGRGCKFTVSIPRGHAHLDPQRLVEHPSDTHSSFLALHAYLEEAVRWTPELPLQSVESEPSPVDPDSEWQHRTLLRSERRRILVAAADRDLRQYLSSIAGELYQVDVAEDSESALRALEHLKPDVLVADMDLQGSDGLAVVRAVRAVPATSALPILLISPHASEENRLRAFAAGANDYLVKPFSAPELLVRLESQLTLAEMQRRVGESSRTGLLDESQLALFAQALDQFPFGIIVAERASGRLVVKNRRIHELFGEFAESIKTIHDIPNPFGRFPDGKPVSSTECPLILSVVNGETILDREMVYSIPEGLTFNAKVTGLPLFSPEGVHSGALVTFRTESDKH